MSITNIKQRLGRNVFDRSALAVSGGSNGELMRPRALKADRKRNLADSFGYPKGSISLEQHYTMANRNGIAFNLCYGIVRDCWREPPMIYDGDKDPKRRENRPTEFEQAVDEHFSRLNVWQFMEDLDWAQRPMRYGAIMALAKESSGATASTPLGRLPTMDYLAGLRVFHEAELPVETAVQDPTRLDYGKPITYGVRTRAPGSQNEWENSGYKVDASRVFAFGENAIGDSIYGIPCLEASFEALMDSIKIRGSAAEGFFQNAANRYAFLLGEGATNTSGEAMAAEMEDFDNGFSKSMMLGNGSVSLLQTTLSDPTHPWTIAVNEACSAHSKPLKVVVGMQTGERASTEDIKQWRNTIMDRQNSECNRMIKGFLEFCHERFTMPRPSGELIIEWRDLNELSQSEQVKTVLDMATINEKQIKSRMEPIFDRETMQETAQVEIKDVLDDMDLLDIGGEVVDREADQETGNSN